MNDGQSVDAPAQDTSQFAMLEWNNSFSRVDEIAKLLKISQN
jgi:hypothetical protein